MAEFGLFPCYLDGLTFQTGPRTQNAGNHCCAAAMFFELLNREQAPVLAFITAQRLSRRPLTRIWRSQRSFLRRVSGGGGKTCQSKATTRAGATC